jgi:ABC-type multidrug transport system ATPase subunit
MRVSQALEYVAGVHPRFDRSKAESFLAKTNIQRGSRVRELSKGMVTQLHLAIVMAIDARLLVLDEPTLGLDILYRKQFYDSLLNDYYDRSRTIVVTTHQVEDIQNVLTDVMFINRGRIVFNCSMEDFESRYVEVMVRPEQAAAAKALRPMDERQGLGRSILLFDLSQNHVDRQQLAALGELRTPSIATCLWPCWEITRAIRPASQKEPLNEYSIERFARIAQLAGSRACDLVGAPALLLVGAARIVGEPFRLYCAVGRRGGLFVRLPDQPGCSAA